MGDLAGVPPFVIGEEDLRVGERSSYHDQLIPRWRPLGMSLNDPSVHPDGTEQSLIRPVRIHDPETRNLDLLRLRARRDSVEENPAPIGRDPRPPALEREIEREPLDVGPVRAHDVDFVVTGPVRAEYYAIGRQRLDFGRASAGLLEADGR